MSPESPDTIASTLMERVWNQLDTDAIDELLTEDHVAYGIGDPIVGKAGWHEFHTAFSGAFSNIRPGIDDQVVSGDKVAASWNAADFLPMLTAIGLVDENVVNKALGGA